MWRRQLKGPIEMSQFERVKELVGGGMFSNHSDCWFGDLANGAKLIVKDIHLL